MNRQTDEMLVNAYAKGDNTAFDILLRRHQGHIFNYILNIVKNKDVADDIFQETFVKAIMTIKQGRYTDAGKFSAWVTRIAHNLIIDFSVRARARTPYRPTSRRPTCSTARTSARRISRTS